MFPFASIATPVVGPSGAFTARNDWAGKIQSVPTTVVITCAWARVKTETQAIRKTWDLISKLHLDNDLNLPGGLVERRQRREASVVTQPTVKRLSECLSVADQ